MDRQLPDFSFRLMSLGFKFRDFFRPRGNILKEVGIKAGFQILDYGCGPGAYIVAVAELVGKEGKIYALDAYPLAVKMVQEIVSKKRLKNVVTILSDCQTGLPDNILDVVLMYDTLHSLNNANCVLDEIHRILKPDGVLSLTDHHMKEDAIVSRITDKALFKLLENRRYTYIFTK